MYLDSFKGPCKWTINVTCLIFKMKHAIVNIYIIYTFRSNPNTLTKANKWTDRWQSNENYKHFYLRWEKLKKQKTCEQICVTWPDRSRILHLTELNTTNQLTINMQWFSISNYNSWFLQIHNTDALSIYFKNMAVLKRNYSIIYFYFLNINKFQISVCMWWKISFETILTDLYSSVGLRSVKIIESLIVTN